MAMLSPCALPRKPEVSKANEDELRDHALKIKPKDDGVSEAKPGEDLNMENDIIKDFKMVSEDNAAADYDRAIAMGSFDLALD